MKPKLLLLLVILVSGCSTTDRLADSAGPPPSVRKIARKDADVRMGAALGYMDLGVYDYAEAYANSFEEGDRYFELAQLILEALDLERASYYLNVRNYMSGRRDRNTGEPRRSDPVEWDARPIEIDVEKEKKYLTALIDYRKKQLARSDSGASPSSE